MLKVGLNGLGRIGRAIFRILDNFEDVTIVAINDTNPEVENMVYLLKYDSYYGRFNNLNVEVKGKDISYKGSTVEVSHESNITSVDWSKHGCDVVIDAAGVHSNLKELPKVLDSGVKKIVVTYSPDLVDHTIVLGANEDTYNPSKHNIVSSSICDVVAFGPVYKIMNDAFGVKGGFLTTLHPWLSYQNVLDGPSLSWGWPGTLYHHYAVGRASTASIIPKPTTAINAADKVLPGILNKMKCYSFRVPTAVVGTADITFSLEKNVSKEDIILAFDNYAEKQKWPILHVNSEPLVSVDFLKTEYSAIVDTRWVEVVNGNLINLTLWYDNEWGYSRRVVDVMRFMFQKAPRRAVDEMYSLSGF